MGRTYFADEPKPCAICGGMFFPTSQFKTRNFTITCSIRCRNTLVGRTQQRNPKPPRESHLVWTDERLAYLIEHYPADGAEIVADALGLSLKTVRNKANTLGFTLNVDTRHRIVHAAAREYMTENNPMHSDESLRKMLDWWEDNPDASEHRHTQFTTALSRVQKNKPTKLEQRAWEILDNLGISYTPQAIIKDKFVVDLMIDRLIIQLDGEYWHGHPRFEPLTERQLKQRKRDKAQTAYLTKRGYSVERIWENELSRDTLVAVLRKHGHA